jgi:nitrogenase subunit NifH
MQLALRAFGFVPAVLGSVQVALREFQAAVSTLAFFAANCDVVAWDSLCDVSRSGAAIVLSKKSIHDFMSMAASARRSASYMAQGISMGTCCQQHRFHSRASGVPWHHTRLHFPGDAAQRFLVVDGHHGCSTTPSNKASF